MPVISGLCSAVFENKHVQISLTENDYNHLQQRFVLPDDTYSAFTRKEIDNIVSYGISIRLARGDKLGDVDAFNALYKDMYVHVIATPTRFKSVKYGQGVGFDGKLRSWKMSSADSLTSVLQEALESKEYMDAHKPFYALES